MTSDRPNNECGGCTACCVVIPVASQEFCKAAGQRCQHLGANGCGIYADRPPVCQGWFCMWRMDAWLGSRPEYRPDRLGVMFSTWADDFSMWEVRPGALADPRIDYIKNKLKSRYRESNAGVRRYPLHILDHVSPTPAMPEGDIPECGVHWQPMGNREYVMVKQGNNA